MQTQRSFLDEMKHQYRSGGMHIRLIFINVLVFIVIGILIMVERLSSTKGVPGGIIKESLTDIFALSTNFADLLYKPWGLITSMFSHFDLAHCLLNMVFLFSAGRMFLQFFSGRRLLYTYILAGLAGGLIEIVAHAIFPAFSQSSDVIVGASGSIMGLFLAVVMYKPNMQVNLFGFIQMPFFILPLLFLISDIVSLGSHDGVAHFAHLGGAFIGFLSVINLNSSSNLITRIEWLVDKIKVLLNRILKPKQKMRVERGGGNTSRSRTGKSDEQYNLDAKARQEKIDGILDKISKSGYESLSKAEKAFLFSQSNNG